ncbi:uncharacterized protein K489DRAFT_385369 [Dissoconium aciculare CBS 342.82]|jgi:hypothetical protein|uniref:Uncharacterized protein n=1 Tax=Dissoconium aciculare CBS 342.82 TaxID=1314786 RepID=A0A6J3LPX5_9PEZI|nr:uncharacterized protein K489DRAFT_385369 [Dissoconium aciculare CBS 342.82]KAF1817976.1 hypothetical protein K489DRAFT_385369 [Dissoconium aciculare CBS 342.82]
MHKVRQSTAALSSSMCFCDRQAIPGILLQGSEKDERSNSIAGSGTSSQVGQESDKDVAILEEAAFVSGTLDSPMFKIHHLV